MSSQVERGTVREMVHTIAYRAGVLEHILQEPVYGSLEVRSDELAHVQLLQRQIDDLCRYLNLPSAEPERKIIYCKDCKFAHLTTKGEVKYCDVWFPETKTYLSADDFCSSAEKRGE